MSGTLTSFLNRSLKRGTRRCATLGRRFAASEQGNVAVLFALVLLPLLAAMGGAMDFSRANGARTELQNAADSAALAARLETSPRLSDRRRTAQDVLEANLGERYGALQVGATIDLDEDLAQVRLTGQVPTILLGLIGMKSIDVAVQAEARGQMLPVCFLALNPAAAGALSGNGISQLSARDCRVQVNSSHARAVNLVGGASVNSASNCFVGGVGQGLSRISPPPEPECGPMEDPFADLALPALGPCTQSGLYTVSGRGTLRLAPGRYCGGLKISDASHVVFEPGIHVIEGPFTVDSALVEGENVTFVLRGTDAGLDWSGNSQYRLSAPRSGSMASMLIYLDPAETDAAPASRMAGSGNTYYEGNIYLPGQTLTLVGNGSTNGASPHTVMVADRFDLRGNSAMNVDRSGRLPGSERLYTGQVHLTR